MNPAPKPQRLPSCSDCPLWPADTQGGFPTQEKIQLCINHVLGGRRQWIASEEFLAQLAAQRETRRATLRKAVEPFQPGPVVRTYLLDSSRMYIPSRPQLIIPKDMP